MKVDTPLPGPVLVDYSSSKTLLHGHLSIHGGQAGGNSDALRTLLWPLQVCPVLFDLRTSVLSCAAFHLRQRRIISARLYDELVLNGNFGTFTHELPWTP